MKCPKCGNEMEWMLSKKPCGCVVKIWHCLGNDCDSVPPVIEKCGHEEKAGGEKE